MHIPTILKDIEETCNKYDFWDRIIYPYGGFGVKVKKIFQNWKSYDSCTYDSQAVIQSEIKGFLPILDAWEEYENEPIIKVKLTIGENAGKVKEYHKSIAEWIVEDGMGVVV